MQYLTIGKPDADMIRRILDSAAVTGESELVQKGRLESAVIAKPVPKVLIDLVDTDRFGNQTNTTSSRLVSGFEMGETSLKNLVGVIPQLSQCAKLALDLSTQDFTVYEGLRTLERQRKLVSQGASQTLHSQHLKQPDGLGHAVDLVPWMGGIPKWDWTGCYKIAFAMDQAATQLGIADRIRWGGAWDRRLSDFGGQESAYKAETELYAARHPGKDFLDGPHFEWVG